MEQGAATYCEWWSEEPDALVAQVRFWEGLEPRGSAYSTPVPLLVSITNGKDNSYDENPAEHLKNGGGELSH